MEGRGHAAGTMITLVLLLGITAVFVRSQEGPGDPCTAGSGVSGTCTDLRECPSVMRTIRIRSPVHCGFNRFIPIVCCPIEEGNPSQNVDVSPPPISFECGISTPTTVRRPLDTSRRRRSALETRRDNSRKKRFVVGGKESKIDAWPWMTLLGERNGRDTNWFCGGVLINQEWVLTALHCLFDFTPNVIRLGEHDYEDDHDRANHQDFNVAQTVLYPDFKLPVAYHDLALIKLASKVTIKRGIRPVCLPWGDEIKKDITGQTVTLTGWGDTQFGGFPSSVLQEVDLTAFPSARCDRNYSNLPHYKDTWPQGIGKETVCAGSDAGGKDACQGDSGGPLVSKNPRGRYILAGITSRGYGCGHEDYPGLYGNLRHPQHLAWIKKIAFSN